MSKAVIHRYSPHPIAEYRLHGVPVDEVSVIEMSPDKHAAWNLFWLSHPSLDSIPGSGSKWFKQYRPTTGLLTKVFRDILSSDDLRDHLQNHPMAFMEWFEVYDTSKLLLDEHGWRELVLSRSQLAVDRIVSESPSVSVSTGSVRYNTEGIV